VNVLASADGVFDPIVIARRHPLGIELEFLDTRAPFDPTVKPARLRHETIDSADARGRGLTLIHSYADKLTYSHDGTYNRIGLIIKSAWVFQIIACVLSNALLQDWIIFPRGHKKRAPGRLLGALLTGQLMADLPMRQITVGRWD
jgi:hypothetical protein